MNRHNHTEAEFVGAFLDAQFARGHSGIVFHEFETLAGVPDIVLLESPSGVDRTEVAVELALTGHSTNGHASVLSSLHKTAPRRIEHIANVTGLAPNYVRRIVTDLKGQGLVQVGSSGSVRLSDAYRDPDVRFTALEFKLRDWRRALAQALRHRSFAAVTVVVMPADRESALRDAADVFREYGVGSAVVDPSSTDLRYIVKPRVRTPTSKKVYLDAVGRAATRPETVEVRKHSTRIARPLGAAPETPVSDLHPLELSIEDGPKLRT